MEQMGPSGYFLLMGVLFLALAGYAAWRMTRRRVTLADQTASYTPISPTSAALAVEAAMEVWRQGRGAGRSAPPEDRLRVLCDAVGLPLIVLHPATWQGVSELRAAVLEALEEKHWGHSIWQMLCNSWPDGVGEEVFK